MHAKLRVQTRDPCNLSGPSKAVRKKSRHLWQKICSTLSHPVCFMRIRRHSKQSTHRVFVSQGNPYRLTTRETCFRDVQKRTQFLGFRLLTS